MDGEPESDCSLRGQEQLDKGADLTEGPGILRRVGAWTRKTRRIVSHQWAGTQWEWQERSLGALKRSPYKDLSSGRATGPAQLTYLGGVPSYSPHRASQEPLAGGPHVRLPVPERLQPRTNQALHRDTPEAPSDHRDGGVQPRAASQFRTGSTGRPAGWRQPVFPQKPLPVDQCLLIPRLLVYCLSDSIRSEISSFSWQQHPVRALGTVPATGSLRRGCVYSSLPAASLVSGLLIPISIIARATVEGQAL